MCYTAGVLAGYQKQLEKYTRALWQNPLPFPSFEQINAMARPFMPVITMDAPDILQPLRWVLVPPKMRTSADLKNQKIWYANARIEELEDKPTYGPLTRDHRCILGISHFYEWRHEGSRKIKFRVSLPEDTPLLIPGLWSESVVDEEVYRSFTLCTTEAQGLMRYIHNTALRMPVITSIEAARVWLDPGESLPKAREAVLGAEKSKNLITNPPPGDLGPTSSGAPRPPLQPELF
ncbi:MAG: SOS response-associated peptidase [Spirochaetales bacterium]|nr:SOS response-associated peptidase [Spirochaetales bacterium]